MKKKILALVLVIALVASLAVALVACNTDDTATGTISFKPIAKDNIKFGLICLHGANSTYDKNFIDAAREAVANMGLDVESQLVIKTDIPESSECYEAAIDLVNQGCNVIFADSFGHESYILQAAKENPTVRFAHATGTTSHTELQANFYNAFASIYEGRYLAGVAAGLKLNEMKEEGKLKGSVPKIGYVGAYPYAEVISGFTSFYLGARSVCPDVVMDVRYTSSWYDEAAEKSTAEALIKGGCDLISQHADSMGAPTACKEKGVPNVTYNISTKDSCANSYLIGSRVNWAPYFEYYINCAINGVTAVGFDWCGEIGENIFDGGSVEVLEINEAIAAEGTEDKLNEVAAELRNGTRKVFDIDTFTVDGKKLTEYLADIDTDAAFEKDTQVIITEKIDDEKSITYFAESLYRSAPYFDVIIDGITVITANA